MREQRITVRNITPEKFIELCAPLKNELFNYIKFMTNNLALASDILEDSLVLAYEKFDSLRDIDKFRSWLWSIVKRQVVLYTKKYKKETPICEIFPAEEQNILFDSNNIDSIENAIFSMDNRQYLAFLMACLSIDEKQFIIFFYFNELSYKEIADLLGDSYVNLRVKHHRILKKLKKRANDFKR